MCLPRPRQSRGSTDIRDIRRRWRFRTCGPWLGPILIALVLALAVGLVWRCLAAARAIFGRARGVIPPHVRARERLRGALALLDQPKPFCIAVSDTLRIYLEERFDCALPSGPPRNSWRSCN